MTDSNIDEAHDDGKTVSSDGDRLRNDHNIIHNDPYDEDSASDDDGYETDSTSSYDSDVTPSDAFLEIRLGTLPHDQLEVRGLDYGNNDGVSQKRIKLNSGLASVAPFSGEQNNNNEKTESWRHRINKNYVRHVCASEAASSAFFVTTDRGSCLGDAFLGNPEIIQELCNVTRHSYHGASDESSSASLPPLLEEALKSMEGAQKAHKFLEEEAALDGEIRKLPRPAVSRALPHPHFTHVIPSASSPNATVTFRQVLKPSPTPRIITLSSSPFIVVHVNGAFMSLTGYRSSEILGRPLYYCLGKPTEEDFSPSVTALHDRLLPVMCKYEDCHNCSLKVSLVGPGSETEEKNTPQGAGEGKEEKKGVTTHYVTHYSIELDPVESGRHLQRRLVSPDSSAYGILG